MILLGNSAKFKQTNKQTNNPTLKFPYLLIQWTPETHSSESSKWSNAGAQDAEEGEQRVQGQLRLQEKPEGQEETVGN